MIRHAPAVVILHWLLAALILLAWVMGRRLAGTPADQAMTALALHMATGVTVAVLMAVRLAARLRAGAPPPKNPLAPVVHWLIYAAVFAMAASGLAMSFQHGLPTAIFAGSALPADIAGPLRQIHGITATILAGLTAIHLAGAMWHAAQGRGVLARMTLGG